MEGHLTTKNGTWYAIYDVADLATGKRRCKWLRLNDCKGKREAREHGRPCKPRSRTTPTSRPISHGGAVLIALGCSHGIQNALALL